MIHDKRGDQHWSSSIEDWEHEFDDGDVVIGDGYDHFRTMTMVHQIQLDELDHVVHRGVFWEEDEALKYAQMLDSSNQMPGLP